MNQVCFFKICGKKFRIIKDGLLEICEGLVSAQSQCLSEGILLSVSDARGGQITTNQIDIINCRRRFTATATFLDHKNMRNTSRSSPMMTKSICKKVENVPILEAKPA